MKYFRDDIGFWVQNSDFWGIRFEPFDYENMKLLKL